MKEHQSITNRKFIYNSRSKSNISRK